MSSTVTMTAANSAAKSGGPHYFIRVTNDKLEILILSALWALSFVKGAALNVDCGWTFRDVILLAALSAIVRRCYNDHLERAFDKYPELRTQPSKKRPENRDVTGRDERELALIEYHDRCTMLAKFSMDFIFYFALGPVLYPKAATVVTTKSFLQLLLHHYTLSFGMYWMHRLLHVNKFLWDHIHSYHHYAKTPLARATYMDHWLDNIMNALIAEIGTQILVPLPKGLLFFSRLFRVCESLEKHSGLAGSINVVHTAQRYLPFAQMPHHHDWHHEGFKGSNYTFASLGGLWDVLFGTRHPGRSNKSAKLAATPWDNYLHNNGITNPLGRLFDHPMICPIPTILFALAVGIKCYAA